MKNVKSILLGTGSLLLAVMVLTLFAPRAVHALAATLVQVTNTSANPVVNQDVDSPGRSPYYQTLACYSASSNQCAALFPAVPPNMRLVVQYISSNLDTPTAMSNAFFQAPGGFFNILHTLQGNDLSGFQIYVASQPMLYYFEAGQQPLYRMFSQPGINQFMSGSVTLTGYLVNLTQ